MDKAHFLRPCLLVHPLPVSPSTLLAPAAAPKETSRLQHVFPDQQTKIKPMPDLLQQAWLLAAHHHGNQRYKTPQEGVTVPYLTHIGAVMIEAQAALQHHPEFDRELLLCCAILHDTLEDTDLTAGVIETAFGRRVLAGVKALTKDESLPTKHAKMEDSLRRILAVSPEIAAVKLCDRINNLGPPPHHWTSDKVTAYREEAQFILDQLGHVSVYLSERLANKIRNYSTS